MFRHQAASAITSLLLGCLLISAKCMEATGRRLQQDERVSIYDGTLPSPELGPRAPPPSVPQILPAMTYESKMQTGHHCGSGCVAGSVIGSIAGFCLLIALAAYCCRFCGRRRAAHKDERSLSQIDLLASGESMKQPELKPQIIYSKQSFCAGNPIFCQIGKCCASGNVIDAEGEEYRVRLFDGSEKTVKDVSLAMNYREGSTVYYTPPRGGESIQGTIVASNGSFWPPFYQLRPQNANGTINTTAQCLKPAPKA